MMWSVLQRLEDIGVIQVDLNDKATVLRANRAFANIIGVTPSDLVGRCLYDLTAHSDRERVMQNVARIQSGSVDDIKYVKSLLREDNTTAHRKLHTLLVRGGDNGEPLYLLAFIYSDPDHDSNSERAERYERILMKVFGMLSKHEGGSVKIDMHNVGKDESNHLNADHGSHGQIGHNVSPTFGPWVIMSAVIIAAAILLAVVLTTTRG